MPRTILRCLQALRRDLRTTEEIFSRPPSGARVFSATSRPLEHGPLSSTAAPPPPSPSTVAGLRGVETGASGVTDASGTVRAYKAVATVCNPRETAGVSRVSSGSGSARAVQIASIARRQRTAASNQAAPVSSSTLRRSSSKRPSQAASSAYAQKPLNSSKVAPILSPHSRLATTNGGVTRTNSKGLAPRTCSRTSMYSSRLPSMESEQSSDQPEETPQVGVPENRAGVLYPRNAPVTSQHYATSSARSVGLPASGANQLPPLRALHPTEESLLKSS